jgi:hypothetical protein
MTVVAQIQALATVESITNDIDTLMVLDRQQKSLTAQVKQLKDSIANTLGETSKDADGKQVPHRGEKYGVKVTIENRVGTVDMEAVIKALGLTEKEFDKQFRGESSAVIKVTTTA